MSFRRLSPLEKNLGVVQFLRNENSRHQRYTLCRRRLHSRCDSSCSCLHCVTQMKFLFSCSLDRCFRKSRKNYSNSKGGVSIGSSLQSAVTFHPKASLSVVVIELLKKKDLHWGEYSRTEFLRNLIVTRGKSIFDLYIAKSLLYLFKIKRHRLRCCTACYTIDSSPVNTIVTCSDGVAWCAITRRSCGSYFRT
jgi:hypothetical protein